MHFNGVLSTRHFAFAGFNHFVLQTRLCHYHAFTGLVFLKESDRCSQVGVSQ